jgi:DNA invertase Pin-like site-specific DNA recombinase
MSTDQTRIGAALLLSADKISVSHRSRDAYVYVGQSTPTQMIQHTESLARQYELRELAVALGWPGHQVVVIDADLGRSGANTDGRSGFKELVADVGLGKVGIVLGIEVSRVARNNADWYQLLDLCALTDTLIADADGVYHPEDFNDRLVLGLTGTMSEAELHLIRSRLTAGLKHKAAKANCVKGSRSAWTTTRTTASSSPPTRPWPRRSPPCSGASTNWTPAGRC